MPLQASAIGKNMTNAKTFLEKRYSDEMALEDAVHTSLLTLKEGFEGQVSGSNIEVREQGKRGSLLGRAARQMVLWCQQKGICFNSLLGASYHSAASCTINHAGVCQCQQP